MTLKEELEIQRLKKLIEDREHEEFRRRLKKLTDINLSSCKLNNSVAFQYSIKR